MSNRRRPLTEARLTEIATCPDCDSGVTLGSTDETGFRLATVQHDDTCPWWRAFQARGVPTVRQARRRDHL
jgi:hypothetical protein